VRWRRNCSTIAWPSPSCLIETACRSRTTRISPALTGTATRIRRAGCPTGVGRSGQQSVQYDQDVNIVVDLLDQRDVAKVRLRAYHSRGRAGYAVASVNVSCSDDRQHWRQVAAIENRDDGEGAAWR